MLINHLSEEEVFKFGKMTYVAEIIKNILFGAALFIYARYPLKTTTNKNESIPYLDMI